MQFHPATEIFPLKKGRAFKQLISDILLNGQHDPIIVDKQGRIIDGRSRYLAIKEIRKKNPNFPIRKKQWRGKGEIGAIIVSLNFIRKCLNRNHRKTVIRNLEDYWENCEREHLGITILPDGRMHTKDATKYLGCHVSTIYRMIQKKDGLRFIKKGDDYFFLQSDLDDWILNAKQRTQTG